MLGIETPEDTFVGAELIDELRAQLTETEHRLSERISQLETQYLGELIAWERKAKLSGSQQLSQNKVVPRLI